MGINRDPKHHHKSARETAAELQQFLDKSRDRSVEDALGDMGRGSLTAGMVWATVGWVVALVVFTALPYGWSKVFPSTRTAQANSAQKTAPPATTPAAATNATTVATTPAPSTAAGNPSANPAEPTTAQRDEAIRRMGLGETKIADPDSNPLESKLDSLLDGAK